MVSRLTLQKTVSRSASPEGDGIFFPQLSLIRKT